MRGSYRIAWLGISLKEGSLEAPPAYDIIASWQDSAKDQADAGETLQIKSPDPSPDGTREESATDHTLDLGTLLDSLPAIIRVLEDLQRSIRLQVKSCHLYFGLGDPVQTAVMSGYLWSAASALGLFRANLWIEPDFVEERMDGDLAAEVRARMLWAVVALTSAIREKKTRKILMGMAKRSVIQ